MSGHDEHDPHVEVEHDVGLPGGPSERGPLLWIGLVAGWAVLVGGVIGALDDRMDTNPPHLAAWVLGATLAHDAVWAFGVVLVGWVTGRHLPVAARAPVRAGVAASALLALLTWPQVRGYGERPATPSALPLDYERNAVVALVVIWVCVAVAARVASKRRHSPTAPVGRCPPART